MNPMFNHLGLQYLKLIYPDNIGNQGISFYKEASWYVLRRPNTPNYH